MKEYIKRLPMEIQSLIGVSRDIAHELGFHAYLVGGFVRDLLLDCPNLDLDIVIEGDGICFAEKLAFKLNGKIVRHHRFLTATVILKNHFKIDVATARKEYYPNPAHLPVVSKGNLQDDLLRRDFTINALAVQITGKDYGRLIDIYNGKKDLDNKQLRILHPLSFIDDPTRILRGIRFEQRFNFNFEEDTMARLKEAVKKNMLNVVQPQRLRDEIIILLKEKCPLKAVKRTQCLTGLDFIFPGLHLSSQNLKAISNLDKEILWLKAQHPRHRHLDRWLIYFMALLDSLDEKTVVRVCNKFVLHSGEEKRIRQYFSQRKKISGQLSLANLKPSRLFHILEPLSYEGILLIKAGSGNRHLQKNIEDFFQVYHHVRISITGHDLKVLGLEPGRYYQEVFKKILDAKLDGEIESKEAELRLVCQLNRRRNVKTR